MDLRNFAYVRRYPLQILVLRIVDDAEQWAATTCHVRFRIMLNVLCLHLVVEVRFVFFALLLSDMLSGQGHVVCVTL